MQVGRHLSVDNEISNQDKRSESNSSLKDGFKNPYINVRGSSNNFRMKTEMQSSNHIMINQMNQTQKVDKNQAQNISSKVAKFQSKSPVLIPLKKE